MKGATWCIHVAEGAKVGQNGLKMGSLHSFVHPRCRGSLLEKHIFDALFTHFWSQHGPFSRHLGVLHGPKRITSCSKCPSLATNSATCMSNCKKKGGGAKTGLEYAECVRTGAKTKNGLYPGPQGSNPNSVDTSCPGPKRLKRLV